MMAALATAGCGDRDHAGPGPVPAAPQTPFWGDPACLPTDDNSTRSPIHQLTDTDGSSPEDSELGAAVDIALFGPSSDDALHADVVLGAPNWNLARGAANLLNSWPKHNMDGDLHGDFSGADSAMDMHSLRMVETQFGVYVRVEDSLTVSFVEGTTVCLVDEDFEATATFPLNAEFSHLLLGPATSKKLWFHISGIPFEEVDFDPGDDDDFMYFRFDLTLRDRFFDSPSVDDQLEFLISNFEVWYCDDWRNPQEQQGMWCKINKRMIKSSCTINNNPFHFDRTAFVVETCE